MPAKKVEGKKDYYVRLRRYGQQGEQGLGRYYFEGKLYKRAGIYRVDAQLRAKMKRTRRFEDVLPEDLEAAQQEAAVRRGQTLANRTRARRREAMRRRRPQVVNDGEGFDTGEGYKPPAEEEVGEAFADGEGDEALAV